MKHCLKYLFGACIILLMCISVFFPKKIYCQDFEGFIISNVDLSSFVLGDFNTDGIDDVFGIRAAFTTTDDINLYINNGTQDLEFTEVQIAKEYDDKSGEIIAGDYDNDGDLDVLTAFGDDRILTIIENHGNDSFSINPLNNLSSNIFRFIDYDGDGDLDIVRADTDSGVMAMFRNEGGSYMEDQVIDTALNIKDIEVADIDYDQDLDIVFVNKPQFSSNSEMFIAYNDNGLFRMDDSEKSVIYQFEDLIIEDVNSDNKLDLVVLTLTSFRVYLQNNDDSYDGREIVFRHEREWGYLAMNILDIDQDGLKDVVLSDFQGPLVWRKKMDPEDLAYSEPRMISGSYNFNKLLYSDFDQDGLTDIAVANDRNFLIFKNNLETSNEERNIHLEISLKTTIIFDHVSINGLKQGVHYSFEVVDVAGNTLKNGDITHNIIRLNGLNPGAYFIRVTDESKRSSKTLPFIKQ